MVGIVLSARRFNYEALYRAGRTVPIRKEEEEEMVLRTVWALVACLSVLGLGVRIGQATGSGAALYAPEILSWAGVICLAAVFALVPSDSIENLLGVLRCCGKGRRALGKLFLAATATVAVVFIVLPRVGGGPVLAGLFAAGILFRYWRERLGSSRTWPHQ